MITIPKKKDSSAKKICPRCKGSGNARHKTTRIKYPCDHPTCTIAARQGIYSQ